MKDLFQNEGTVSLNLGYGYLSPHELNNLKKGLSMELGKIKPAKGAVQGNKRIGRGQGSGWGKTAARGHNGQKSRSGFKNRAWFEGGQMPLQRRLPKFGFFNLFAKKYQIVNIDTLSELAEKHNYQEVTMEIMEQHRLIGSKEKLVKILGRGELKSAVTVHANAFTKSAKEIIEKAGGKVNLL